MTRYVATALFALALTIAFTQVGNGAMLTAGLLAISAVVVLSRDGALNK